MKNFETCLNTLNIAGRVYTDPRRSTSKRLRAETDMTISIQKLRDTFSDPTNLKMFCVELCDGKQLVVEVDEQPPWYRVEQPVHVTLSRHARLFLFESDKRESMDQRRMLRYLPVTQILNVLLVVEYQGYISFEVSNRSLNEEGDHIVREH